MERNKRWMMLFDIDGTLLDMDGRGRTAFLRGLERATGVPDDLADAPFAGRTDRHALEQAMAARGRKLSAEDARRIFDCIAAELRELLRQAPATAIAGARPFLERLAEAGAAMGLVTGNARACAYLKLASVGFDRHFAFGGFSDVHAERDEIAFAALEAARAAGLEVPAGRICLVGDTPFDVAAGKALGAAVIGVASGRYGEQALRDCGADLVVRDLADTERLLDWLHLAGVSP